MSDHDFTHEELCHFARIQFAVYVELMFPVLFPGVKFQWAPYIDVVSDLLERCADGEVSRAIVNMPPGFMKSTLISILYVTWRMGRDPTWRFVCISYGDDLAHFLSVARRNAVTSETYRAIFPSVTLEKKAENHLTTTQGGFIYATSVLSDITGFRPHEIICDDPLEPKEALSETRKQAIMDWLTSSVFTRFLDPAKSVFILVMHRLAPDDPAGRLAAMPGWDVLSLPLVAEKHERFLDRDGEVLMERKPGDFLHPDRMDEGRLAKLKAEIGSITFYGQYQQRPTFGGSGLLSVDRIARYNDKPEYLWLCHSWDIGVTATGNATVCTKWGIWHDPSLGFVVDLLDVIVIHVDAPDVRAAIKGQDKIDEPDVIALDERGAGRPILQELYREGYKHVFRGGSEGGSNEGKHQRFSRASIAFYDGKARLPMEANFLNRVLYVLASFPDLKEFDLIDSITQVAANVPTVAMFARQQHRPEWLRRNRRRRR